MNPSRNSSPGQTTTEFCDRLRSRRVPTWDQGSWALNWHSVFGLRNFFPLLWPDTADEDVLCNSSGLDLEPVGVIKGFKPVGVVKGIKASGESAGETGAERASVCSHQKQLLKNQRLLKERLLKNHNADGVEKEESEDEVLKNHNSEESEPNLSEPNNMTVKNNNENVIDEKLIRSKQTVKAAAGCPLTASDSENPLFPIMVCVKTLWRIVTDAGGGSGDREEAKEYTRVLRMNRRERRRRRTEKLMRLVDVRRKGEGS
jgi:hypothetical protein